MLEVDGEVADDGGAIWCSSAYGHPGAQRAAPASYVRALDWCGSGREAESAERHSSLHTCNRRTLTQTLEVYWLHGHQGGAVLLLPVMVVAGVGAMTVHNLNHLCCAFGSKYQVSKAV